MPPKKTKPNEKCPCGSGKKHKKCCMVAAMVAASSAPPPPKATTVVNEVMEALTLTTTASNTATAAAASESSGPCSHGSTSTHFPDGRAYSDVIKELLSTSQEGRAKFVTDHGEYFKDSNFSQYIFYLCTSWYLETNKTPGNMVSLLGFATVYKYTYDSDKVKRYIRALHQDRGVINCLTRETKSFCDCMLAKKMEAKGMAKMEYCHGCNHSFPRKDMLICNGCFFVLYCGEECQTKDWTKHKKMCQGL